MSAIRAVESSGQVPVGIVCRTLPPYRVHMHRRFAREIPEIRLITLNTHLDRSRDWEVSIPDCINLVDLSDNERLTSTLGITTAWREWRRGARITSTLRSIGVKAVVVNGYSDPGYWRTITWSFKNHVPCFLCADSNLACDRASGFKKVAKRFYVKRIILDLSHSIF